MSTSVAAFRRAKFKRTQFHRRGLMIIAALVCLLVVTSLVGSMLKNALRARRELHTERDRRQAELLIEAGASRAAARLASSPAFRGDTWELPAADIVGQGGGRVTTEITSKENQATLQLRVAVEYPIDRDFPIRRSQTFNLKTSKPQSQE